MGAVAKCYRIISRFELVDRGRPSFACGDNIDRLRWFAAGKIDRWDEVAITCPDCLGWIAEHDRLNGSYCVLTFSDPLFASTR